MRYPVIGYLTRAYIRAGHIALLQTLRPDTIAGRLDYVEVTMRYLDILLEIHNRNIVCFKMLTICIFSHNRRNKPWKKLCWYLRKRLRWLTTFGVTKVNIHYSNVIIGAVASQIINHRIHDCLLNRLFRRRSTNISKLRVTGLCEGNSPVTGEFPSQRASNTVNGSIWWRHHF